MISVVLTLAAVVVNVVGAGMSMPQTARVLRTCQTAGVSHGWVGVSLAFNAGWIAWGVATGSWVVVPMSIVSAASYLVLAISLVRLERTAPVGRRIARAMAVASMLPAVAFGIAGWTGVGLTLGVLFGAQLTPAAVAAYRSRDLRGVSPSTWAMAWVEALMWVVLGVAHTDGALLVAGVGGLMVASLILARIAWLAATPGARVVAIPYHVRVDGGAR